MKALSIIMPWPVYIMKHGKDVENRTWRTDYRGRILIHVSKKVPYLYLYRNDLTLEEMEESKGWYGHIIGSAELVDCVQNYPSPWAEPGVWHWVLKNPVLFKEPIPAKGSLGLWEYKEYGEQK